MRGAANLRQQSVAYVLEVSVAFNSLNFLAMPQQSRFIVKYVLFLQAAESWELKWKPFQWSSKDLILSSWLIPILLLDQRVVNDYSPFAKHKEVIVILHIHE